MTWILIAYLIALLYFAVRKERISAGDSLRKAWIWFAMIPLSHFFFTLFRAGNFGNARDMALIEIWSDGVVWLMLGVSLLYLTGIVARDRESGPPPPPFA